MVKEAIYKYFKAFFPKGVKLNLFFLVIAFSSGFRFKKQIQLIGLIVLDFEITVEVFTEIDSIFYFSYDSSYHH